MAFGTKQSSTSRISLALRRINRYIDSLWFYLVSLYAKLRPSSEVRLQDRQQQPPIENENNSGPYPARATVEISGESTLKPARTQQQRTALLASLREFAAAFWQSLHDPAFFVAVCALIALSVFVYESIKTNRLTQQALQVTNTNFVKDQRPYIWIAKIVPPQVPKSGEPLKWTYRFNNFGKSPAIAVADRCQILLTAHHTPERSDMFAPIHDATHKQDGLVIPPGDDGNSATCSSEPETPNNDDLKLLAKEDGMAKLTIFFEYFDTSGNLYTSQICLLLKQRAVNITTVSMCPTENKIQ